MRTKVLLMLFPLLVCIGCHKKTAQPRHIVVMTDVSGSIEAEALSDAFNSIAALTQHLRRGDRLTIIPITGDAQNQTSGRILRFQLPIERQPYDSDIANVRIQVVQTLEDAKQASIGSPGARTDLLGAFELAGEEFAANPEDQRVLIILSDFIQDDGHTNFNSDPRLGKSEFVQTAVDALPKAPEMHASVYLGYLRSRDSERLSNSRRRAIRQYWVALLQKSGAKVVTATDGPGLLVTALSRE